MLHFLKSLFSEQPQPQRKNRGKTFLLEPILTPSGLPLDFGDETPDFDEQKDLSEVSFHDTSVETHAHDAIDLSHVTAPDRLDLDNLEEIPFFDADGDPDLLADSSADIAAGRDVVYNVPAVSAINDVFSVPETNLDLFTSGIFTVSDTGEVEIDYLWDGGSYQGQLALFNLQGIDQYEPGSQDFILEALHRVLDSSQSSSSPLGFIAIDDLSEGARFSGNVGEGNFNSGTYSNIKTFHLEAGSHWGAILIPNGTAEEVWNILNDPNATLPKNLRPLFSLATANPDDGLQFGQIGDVTGDGHTFAFEDLRIDGRTDKDYNDLVFQIRGATGDAVHLNEVINPAQDWRNTEIGQSLVEYATFRGQEIPISEHLPDVVQYAIERAEDLNSYEPEQLAQTHQWIVGVSSNELSPDLLTLLEAENKGAVGHIPNTYLWEFAPNRDTTQIGVQLESLTGVEFAYPLVPQHHELRDALPDNTPYWQLHNAGQTGGTPHADLNVVPAWNLGYKGNGITIGIVDDGIQYNHPSLKDNYRSDLSRDFFEKVGGIYDPNPLPYISPVPGLNAADSHGTAMASLAAGKGESGLFGTAPKASVVGLRLVPNALPTDLTQADTLSYLKDDIDIFNNSWGPSDDSNKLEAPDPLAQMVLHTTATQGREGKGGIFVWAAGNGQEYEGNVNYDGYANSRYAIAVAALDHNGLQASYSEAGASVFVSAPGGDDIAPIVSAYAHPNRPQSISKGTSAAAALTSGVVALMLDANHNLTRRDVQHILVETSRKTDPNDVGWRQNAAGYWTNDKYGFGVIDAEAAVKAAKDWTLVGTEVKVTGGLKTFKKAIPGNGAAVTDSVTINEDITVEWAEVMFDATHSRPEDLEVVLVSPDGTRSVLAEARGDTDSVYKKWVFTSTRSWGESAKGDWKLEVRDKKTGETGTWNQWKLNLYGAQPTVTIKATDADASESGDTGEFTVYRTGSNKFPLTVNYDLLGEYHWSRPKAKPGIDYEELPGSITIPAGASSATFKVQPFADNQTEWPQTVRLKLKENESYEVGEQDIDAVTIKDVNIPELTLLAEWYGGNPGIAAHTFASTSESEKGEQFLLRRVGGDISKPLDVYYSMQGKAEKGVDYIIPVNLTIPAGENDFYFGIVPIKDNLVEGDEDFEIILTPDPTYKFSTGNNRVYDRIPGILWDSDNKPSVKIEATKASTFLGGEPGQFTITRTGDDLSNPLSIELYVHRDWRFQAKNGIDFKEISETIKIPAGQDSVLLDIEPLKGDLERQVDIFLKTNSAYAISTERAQVTILDTNPKIAWKQQLGTSVFDAANSVAIDAAGNAYITGRTAGNLEGSSAGLSDAFVAKYDKTGTLKWVQQDGTLGYDEAKGIAVDAAGNSYITGWTDGELGGSRDAWLAKYNSSGQLLWKKFLSSSSSQTNTGYDISKGAITMGADGAVYLTGYTQGNLGGTNQGQADAFVAKFDSNGNRIWVKQVGSGAWDEANGVAADSLGNVYIAGVTQGLLGDGKAGDKDAWVAKFNKDGMQQWVKQLGTVASDEALGVAVDPQGRVYLAGQTKGWLGDAYAGDPGDWLGDHDAYWAGIHGDRSGLGGTYYGEGDAWVAQFDGDGTLAWKRNLGTPQADVATGIAADATGVYITGTTSGTLKTAAGAEDAFVAKYDARGALLWKQQFGSSSNEGATGIAVGSEGIYVAGLTSGSFGGTSKGGRDAWVAKLA
ncbi:S8 family serine peptidase [Oscillatoria sp. FACHB-1406]|uniref:S8 family serine peptidase n=1 Tax=Oscillatoria sp. FACHB-1406 TaxID=2692846 RepID=UPI001686E618|nr:S8 family serine peptidase [Oscillatoria sp. FACHB-1406]MBD2577131.1 S8 family serine peptidase [Oscillatoria sp. FACHB-1406]